MKKHLLFIVMLLLALITITVRAQSVYSDFSSGDEGWVITGTNGTYIPPWYSALGNPGGCIGGNFSIDPGTWVFLAPAKFTGDKSGAYNHSFAFDLMLTMNDPQFDAPDVTLIGNGMQIVYDLPRDTITTWQKYVLILNETAGWHLTSLIGVAPTAEQMKAILANLTHLEIRGKFTSGTGAGFIDNVYMSISSPLSNFSTDYEGWRIVGDAQGGTGMPNYHSAGGHPGGYLSAKDDVTGGTWYWQAPGKFLGDMSTVYGQNLKFDLKQSGLDNQFDNYDVILQGPSSKLVYNTPNNPDTAWTSYSIAMTESSGWHLDDTLGPAPTHAEFLAVLSYLQDLLIRGEYISGADSGSIDNVSLGSISGIPSHDYISHGELTIFPNPAKEYATLQFIASQAAYFTVELFTETGQRTSCHKDVYCSAGIQEITLPLHNLSSGIYFFTVNSSHQALTGRVVVR
jgi:Laminin B (Domain IV)/Secretion system C-terminal sorting domain